MKMTQREAAAELDIALTTFQDHERGTHRTTGEPIKTPRLLVLACSAIEFGTPTIDRISKGKIILSRIRFGDPPPGEELVKTDLLKNSKNWRRAEQRRIKKSGTGQSDSVKHTASPLPNSARRRR